MFQAHRPQFEYRWLIVVIGFLSLAIAFSARAALGLMLPIWQLEFGWSQGFISSVGASALIVMAIVAPFAGRLIDTRGPAFALILGMGLIALGSLFITNMGSKWMFILGFAILSAVGFGIVATHVVATAVTRSFKSNVGLATGMATSGATGGQFLIMPLIALLLTLGSWRWSFAAMAIVSLLLMICAKWMLKVPEGTRSATDNVPENNVWSDLAYIFRKPAFHALFWSFLICGFTTTGVIETHLLPFASFCGFPPLPSASAYGVLSLVNLAGMIGAGWLSDRMNRPLLLAAIYGARALTFILLANLPGHSVETLFLFAVLFGAVDYSTVPVTASLMASHVGVRVMGLGMGVISAGHAIGGALGTFAGGYFFDITGNYDLLWISSLWMAFGAGILVLLIYWLPEMKDPEASAAY